MKANDTFLKGPNSAERWGQPGDLRNKLFHRFTELSNDYFDEKLKKVSQDSADDDPTSNNDSTLSNVANSPPPAAMTDVEMFLTSVIPSMSANSVAALEKLSEEPTREVDMEPISSSASCNTVGTDKVEVCSDPDLDMKSLSLSGMPMTVTGSTPEPCTIGAVIVAGPSAKDIDRNVIVGSMAAPATPQIEHGRGLTGDIEYDDDVVSLGSDTEDDAQLQTLHPEREQDFRPFGEHGIRKEERPPEIWDLVDSSQPINATAPGVAIMLETLAPSGIAAAARRPPVTQHASLCLADRLGPVVNEHPRPRGPRGGKHCGGRRLGTVGLAQSGTWSQPQSGRLGSPSRPVNKGAAAKNQNILHLRPRGNPAGTQNRDSRGSPQNSTLSRRWVPDPKRAGEPRRKERRWRPY